MWNIPRIIREITKKNVNLELAVRLGNTWISTDYAQKSPRTLDNIHLYVPKVEYLPKVLLEPFIHNRWIYVDTTKPYVTRAYNVHEYDYFFHLVSKWLRATSHTRLRARDHSTSSTFIGGKGGAGPSSLHTTFAGPTEYVNARWM